MLVMCDVPGEGLLCSIYLAVWLWSVGRVLYVGVYSNLKQQNRKATRRTV